MDTARARRIATNESRIRTANEQNRERVDGFRGDDDGDLEIMCECALDTCESMLHVTRATYERVRAHDTWFLVAPEHIEPGFERLVEQLDSAWILEKLGESAEIAEQLA
jgi:hypothetical protein